MGSSDSGSSSIPVDEQYTQDDGDDTRTFTSGRTLATTTTMYRHENGRTYHAYRDGEYWQPNDEQQNNHEGIVHHLCIMTLKDRLFLAPVSDPRQILDVGTGTGIWASDVADRYPNSNVIGVDLSPVQSGMHPSNCTFEIDDCCSKWVYPENHFDFIHMRGLFGSIADWPALYSEVYKHTAPGGYFEQLEWSTRMCFQSDNGHTDDGQVLQRWAKNFVDIGDRTGKSFTIAEDMFALIKHAGFEDVVERRFKWPIGPWSSDPRMKEIGRWNLLSWEQGMEGWALALHTRVLGWSYQQVQAWLAELRRAIRGRKHHAYHEVVVVYGRKPK